VGIRIATSRLERMKNKIRQLTRRSQGRAIEEIRDRLNPVIRGWVNYFAFGHSARCFSYVRNWVEKKIRRHLMQARQRQGFGWKRWSTPWLYRTLGLFEKYQVRRWSTGRKQLQLDMPHNPW
jgi:RNA-directed DNA polymerase